MSISTDPPPGRDSRGLFAPGNRIARGNANAKRQHELRRILLDSITPEQVRAVGEKLAALAVEGDVQAARLLLEHVVGKPAQPVEVSGLDGAPIGQDVDRIRVIILAALADQPDAQRRVARALLESGGDRE